MPTILARNENVNEVSNYPLQVDGNQPHCNESRSANKHGLLVASRIEWKNWQPGSEYIKHVLIKNTQLKIQKITYEIPESRFFTTLYPKPIILNAGTSYSLPITFHPLEKKVYRDVLKCHTNNEDFEVVLLASLPLVRVIFPKTLVMPRCTVYGSIEKNFQLKNTGETAIPIKWLFSEPFEIKPEECIMDPGTTCSFNIIFRPKFAKLYEGLMVCQLGSEETKYKKLRIVAQGKYPHFLVSVSGAEETTEECFDGMKTSVCFESVAVGFTKQEVLMLKNLSLVEVPFKIEHPLRGTHNRLDAVFDVPIKNGVIPPLSSVELPILFSPGIVSVVYVDYFYILPIGSMTRNIIKCVGNSIGPKIYLEPEWIDFKKIDLGNDDIASVELVNNTNVPATYQFLIDTESSCFRFSSVCGMVKPHSSMKVSIKFCPPFAMNYYRCVTCLIHNQDPLFLDLLGTCHSELVNPAVLKIDHVKSSKIRCNQGFSSLPPDQLNELLEKKAMKLAPDGSVLVPETHITDSGNNSRNPMAEFFASNPSTEECIGHVSDPPITLHITHADFGRCTSLRTTVEKMLCVTNNTRGKVCVQWIAGSQKIFSVHPSFMEISSLKSGVLKVFFNPDMPNQLYGAELECFIYYKCMLDYRLIPDETLCPPWCYVLSCTGHTFSPEKESFIARHIILDQTDLCLPSTALQEVSYKTFIISNTGKTPLLYEFDNDPTGNFSIKPDRGLIQSGHQICVVRFSPKSKQLHDQILNVRFNDTNKSLKAVRFVGLCEDPEILLENGGEIYFKQTCIGTSSTSQYSFKNLTKKLLNFEWKIKNADDKEISIHPNRGQILPNDSFNHQCVFSPIRPGRKVFKLKLLIWSEDSAGNSSQFQVRAIGTGTSGEITVESSYHNFGDIVVGRLAQYNIVLWNNSTCSLVCKLLVQQTANDEDLPFSENTAIHLSEWEIDMPAKSKHVIRASVRPLFQASYRFAVGYQLLLDKDQVKDPSLLEPKHLCHLLMNGVFPSLIVTDIRGQGCAREISKRQLWTLFSLDSLNSYFNSDPSYQELMYSMETQKTTERLPAFNTQAIVEFNFSAAPLHSLPSTFILQIENNSTVSAEWAFLFPDDMKLEVEPWADTGDLNDEELHQMKVLENQLFMVEPKNGYLKPGEGMAITLTYNHMLTGTDRLNILLKVVNGREILLNFVGVTVEPERHYIHFHTNKHTFLPMPVGKIYHPKQIYELYNGGAQTIHYKVDIRPLIQLEKQNYNHRVFECMNPCGTLSSGKSAFLEWKFSPLECMTYTVDVPIHIEGGETALITFIGIGYDAEAMGQTMPLLDTSLNMNIPDSQAVALPGQIVGLSKERISLGNIPLFAMKCGLVFVNNWSTDRQVTFNWQFASSADIQLLSINPVKGLLQPKESKLCQLSFMDCGLPGFYDIDLICEITDETEVAKYKEELRLWENERNRQQVEFTITEKNPNVVTPEMNDIELVVSPGRMFPFTFLSEESSPMEEQLVGYRTLPPIRQIPVDKQMDILRHTKKFQKKKYWKKPQPPSSFSLHLGITARTYDVEEFEVGHPNEYRHYFLDKIFGQNSMLNSEEKRQGKQKCSSEMMICSDLHREMLCEVMSNIIRGLLVDTYFHDALKDIQYEKVPYYQQLVQEVPAPPLEIMSIEESEKKLNAYHLSSQIQTQDNQSAPRSLAISSVSSRVDGIDSPMTKGEKEEMESSEMDLVETMEEKEKVKHLDEFSSFLDSFLESCLHGIMQEAMQREFNITAPSRFIALPKKNSVPGPVGGAKP